jgi:hypothetical protein
MAKSSYAQPLTLPQECQDTSTRTRSRFRTNLLEMRHDGNRA